MNGHRVCPARLHFSECHLGGLFSSTVPAILLGLDAPRPAASDHICYNNRLLVRGDHTTSTQTPRAGHATRPLFAASPRCPARDAGPELMPSWPCEPFAAASEFASSPATSANTLEPDLRLCDVCALLVVGFVPVRPFPGFFDVWCSLSAHVAGSFASAHTPVVSMRPEWSGVAVGEGSSRAASTGAQDVSTAPQCAALSSSR